MIVIIALHIIKQTVQNYCIQFELLLTKSQQKSFLNMQEALQYFMKC